MSALLGDCFDTDSDLFFNLVSDRRPLLHNTTFVGEWKIGEILVRWINPPVADEEAFNIPLDSSVGISLKDSIRYVGNMLSCIRLPGKVNLQGG